ncbi:hypothetical protein [Polaromonas sp. CG_9.11]|uniref:hypothetical protein n=1 Tax=Polaromonas sp. CG_9.11 TaxID=2787730 RepID=UPI0018C9FE1D|nr:hypothetical protein [Polaromonas sp. CG_9.11]MBG6077299.1 hypothetical protein [Polaromonas sp. CG_9.11]
MSTIKIPQAAVSSYSAMRLLAASWLRLLAGLLVAMLSFSAAALNCATPGKDGAGGTLNGVINRYWPGTASASAGATSIVLGSSIGSGAAIAVGDLLLVIQVQDAAIDRSNDNTYGSGNGLNRGSGSTALNSAGLYEYVRATNAAAIGGGTVTVVGGSGAGLLNTYTDAAASSTQGQRRFQVVRVPQYTTATLGSGLTAMAWNGSTGGVLVFDVAGQLTLGGATVSVNGLGFRGGAARELTGGPGANTDYRTNAANDNNGSKGEGIAGTPRYVNNLGVLLNTGSEGYPNGSHARGAPGNAGGGGTDGNPVDNKENTGGGGGSNAGGGGKGGNGWRSASPTGGFGGFDYAPSLNPGRLFLGGGGGSGTNNNGTGDIGAGFASSGAAGGGLVMIRAGSITGNGTISANGANANNSARNDGSGGGGAGGSVLVYVNAVSAGLLSVQVKGGNGGTNAGGTNAGSSAAPAHGPGGGGSGGFVVTSATVSASINFDGGAAGTTVVNTDNFGATAGNSGTNATLNSGQIPGVSSGSECSPRLVFMKTVSVFRDPFNNTTNPKNIPGAEVLYTLRVTNTGTGTVDTGATVITDPIPANTELFLGDLGVANSGPIAFVQGTSTLTWTFDSLASTSDDVSFSKDNCANFVTPTPTLNYDSTVNCIRLNPKGVMAAASAAGNSYFELKFRVRVK